VGTEDIVAQGKDVYLDYVLTAPSGAEFERSGEDSPLVYLHGADNIVEGLEEALAGRSVGDELEVEVPPEKGYGVRRKVKAQRVPRSRFPKEAKVEKGTQFVMQGPDGKHFPVWVTKVMGKQVHLSPQHPMAGTTLCFEARIRDVRDATEEELAHGHPHGPGGHEHPGDGEG